MRQTAAPELMRHLARLEGAFSVTVRDAREMIGNFHREMSRGLAGETSSLKMLPTFARRPQGTEKGNFLAVDLGGTHLRVMAVNLDGKGRATITAASRSVIPPQRLGGAGEELFDFIADRIALFFREHPASARTPCDLALTFSFPVAQRSITSGVLIGWTKAFSVSGVEGRDIAPLLSEAMKRRGLGPIRLAALANDAAGTLAAGCYSDPSCDVGVILGTGTNACYVEKTARILKRPDIDPPGEMIVNLEWGGFDKLRGTAYDDALDKSSRNAGEQRLEKMVAGMYLGEIVRLAIAELTDRGLLSAGAVPAAWSEAYALTAEHLSRMARDGDVSAALGRTDLSPRDSQTIPEIGRIVSTRSARIAGAAIAAVVTWMDAGLESVHTVAVDGSLFEKYQGYQNLVTDILRDLFGDRAERIRLKRTGDGSGIGSAVIGAVAASVRS